MAGKIKTTGSCSRRYGRSKPPEANAYARTFAKFR
jgi:hypothetical protein